MLVGDGAVHKYSLKDHEINHGFRQCLIPNEIGIAKFLMETTPYYTFYD